MQEYHSLRIPDESRLEKRRKLVTQKKKIEEEINKIVWMPENAIPFCVPGRMIKIAWQDVGWGWGIIVSFSKQRINPKKFLGTNNKNKEYLDILSQTENHYILDVLVYVKNRLTPDNLL